MAKFILILLVLCSLVSVRQSQDLRLLVVTVATENTDGFQRYLRSAKVFGLDVEVFGMNEMWLGGNMESGPGGGYKINILKESLRKYKDAKDLLLMFTDSYDVIFNAGKETITKRFLKTNASILISAEDYCWPDAKLEVQYPSVETGYKFLCSGGIIGYANVIYEVISAKTISHTDDDQLYYTQLFLEQREKYGMKLDHTAEIFQNLHGAEDDVQLHFDGDVLLWNKQFNTYPVVVHGNGPTKVHLNHYGNYLAKSWNFDHCQLCQEHTYLLKDLKVEKWPRILIGLFIPTPTPFIVSFLEHISNLDYPKYKIDIFLHSIEPHHDAHIHPWLDKVENLYNSIVYKGPRSFLTEREGRNLGITYCEKVYCDYYFSVDGSVTLSNRMTLQLLLEHNRTFIAPMITKPGKLWSNFWGLLGEDGFYSRSPDYIDIVKYDRVGVWNVPFVSGALLIKASTVRKIGVNPFFSDDVDQDMTFCRRVRQEGVFMFVSNMHDFGHIKETSTYTTNYKHNDLYQIFENRVDWEDRYLHPDFHRFLDPTSKPMEPCPDVYWFPFVTTNFSKELVDEMEYFGKWSGGKNTDSRISGGYENVPTVDIHLNQVGLEKQWLQMLKDYVAPMCRRYFTGYNSYAHAIMNFVVKYSTNGQYYLRPHHDASTYTINMALNSVDEYEGGGARFTRYNCSVTKTKDGWALMHPGRLTHQHEGLPLLKGLRYIMVSFIDP